MLFPTQSQPFLFPFIINYWLLIFVSFSFIGWLTFFFTIDHCMTTVSSHWPMESLTRWSIFRHCKCDCVCVLTEFLWIMEHLSKWSIQSISSVVTLWCLCYSSEITSSTLKDLICNVVQFWLILLQTPRSQSIHLWLQSPLVSSVSSRPTHLGNVRCQVRGAKTQQ